MTHRSACGYRRDGDRIDCPRAAAYQSPCIARDGRAALADDLTCTGCSSPPGILLAELDRAAGGVTIVSNGRQMTATSRTYYTADALARRVRQLTAPRRAM